jgi:hypothetical protein
MALVKSRPGALEQVLGRRPEIACVGAACQHRGVMPIPRVLCRIALGLLLVATPSIAAEPTPVPPAGPPTSLDEIPSAKREDVTRLLRKIRTRHGDDAVVIQTHLLLNAMQKGSVLATGVRVDRVEEARGKRYLAFVVETGFVFDDTTRDRIERAQILWATIMEPMLARLEDGLQVHKADGMLVQMQYFHRPYRSAEELRAHIHEPGTSEEARFYVSSADVDDIVRGRQTTRTVLTQVRTMIDGADLAVAPPTEDAALTPGPE